ncbi:uncharacterized protein LOC120134296 [Hibiscus syriacus]|uniref:uncharacterized protein LOC120134296 n=1 Tax=Hibiscus syriacus TaxID=106335 RepID=UPI00192241F2|nr:uncharacterized protein LOC120134296 [Hibiscus syriacus]
MSLIKNILPGEGSLWVAWLRSYMFNTNDFWYVVVKTNMSWSLKQILKLRTEASSILPSNSKKVCDIWNGIRVKNPKVHWHSLLWFPLLIPKHSLIAWMIFLDRLPTKERLHRMGVDNECHCIFCGAGIETRNHLFFECPVATALWFAIFSLNGLRFRHLSWDSLYDWDVATWKGISLLTSIMKISSNALIYIIWKERNKRFFQCHASTVEAMFSTIKEIVGFQLRAVVNASTVD